MLLLFTLLLVEVVVEVVTILIILMIDERVIPNHICEKKYINIFLTALVGLHASMGFLKSVRSSSNAVI